MSSEAARWESATLWFQGWMTTVANLRTAGWQFYSRPHFTARTIDGNRRGGGLRRDCEYVYLNHPDLALFGRFTVPDEPDCVDMFRLDFMVTRKQIKRAALKVTVSEIGAEDVGELLALIKEIQSAYPAPKPPPARVEMVTFKRVA